MNFIEMWEQMGPIAKGIGVILIIMSMISFGVAIERIYTFTQARKQSKLFAPQVAKHLRDGRLKEAIAEFTEALRLEPGNERALRNLELARSRLGGG